MRLVFLVAAFSVCRPSAAANWPQWRGPGSNGISAETKLAEEWSPTKNIAWKSPVPGRGRSSPIVWGDRIFLTTDIEGEKIDGLKPPVHKFGNDVFRHPDSTGMAVKHRFDVLCFEPRLSKLARSERERS